jgi:transposase
VDRSTIMRLREVAKQGALAALAESRPGVRSKEQDLELAQAKAEATRLGEALKELAVKLLLVEGNGPVPGAAGRARAGRHRSTGVKRPARS